MAGTDYSAASGTLTFTAGQTSQTFTISILDNPAAGGDRTVNLTLSNPGTGAVLGSPTTAVLTIHSPLVVHTITYNQITSVTGNACLVQFSTEPVLSANGNCAVFDTTGGQTYTVNSDGSGLTLVDPHEDSNLAISANGAVVLDTTGHGDGPPVGIQVVNADGSNLHTVFTAPTGGGVAVFATLSPDGSTVYFTDQGSFDANDPPGLYSLPASAVNGTPHLVVSQAQLAQLLNTTASNITVGVDETSMGVSADGSHIVFDGILNNSSVTAGAFLVSVLSNGSALSQVGFDNVPFSLHAAGISGDGTKVFRYDQLSSGQQLTVYNFDGSNLVILNNLPSDLSSGDERLQLTQDGRSNRRSRARGFRQHR